MSTSRPADAERDGDPASGPLASLHWPPGIARTPPAQRAAGGGRALGGRTAIGRALKALARATGEPVSSIILSAQRDHGASEEPGVALWFMWRGVQRCITCDLYARQADNVRAVAFVIRLCCAEAGQGMAVVRGTLDRFIVMDRLADDSLRPWYEILGVARDVPPADTHEAYVRLAKIAHPNAGGSVAAWHRLAAAYAEAQAEAARTLMLSSLSPAALLRRLFRPAPKTQPPAHDNAPRRLPGTGKDW